MTKTVDRTIKQIGKKKLLSRVDLSNQKGNALKIYEHLLGMNKTRFSGEEIKQIFKDVLHKSTPLYTDVLINQVNAGCYEKKFLYKKDDFFYLISNVKDLQGLQIDITWESTLRKGEAFDVGKCVNGNYIWDF